jgi:integrase
LYAHREFIFPGIRNPKTHTNEQTANAALKRMGYEGTLVAHGLRALGSTTLNEKGFDRDVIESALAHSDKDEVRSAYNRSDYLERRREMMIWWSEHIDAASRVGSALTWLPSTNVS